MSKGTKPVAKIRCECGRNLAFAYRPEHDRHGDGPQVGQVVPRPGVAWSKILGPFVRPGGLEVDSWVATCPACGSTGSVSAGAVTRAVAAGESELWMTSSA